MFARLTTALGFRRRSATPQLPLPTRCLVIVTETRQAFRRSGQISRMREPDYAKLHVNLSGVCFTVWCAFVVMVEARGLRAA